MGNKWSKIAKVLKGRTENAVRNRLSTLVKNAKQMANYPFLSDDIAIDMMIEQLSSKEVKI